MPDKNQPSLPDELDDMFYASSDEAQAALKSKYAAQPSAPVDEVELDPVVEIIGLESRIKQLNNHLSTKLVNQAYYDDMLHRAVVGANQAEYQRGRAAGFREWVNYASSDQHPHIPGDGK